jgi:hypothetical protein
MTAAVDSTEPARQRGCVPPSATAPTPTVLKSLLRERSRHSYAMFKRAYIKAAKKLDPSLADAYPSDRTYKR